MSPPADSTLIIRHQPNSDPAKFQLIRPDGKATDPVELQAPFTFPVEGRPNSNLMRELQWYLETFLDYPFPPETDHAERVRKSLQEWGRQAKVFREKKFVIVWDNFEVVKGIPNTAVTANLSEDDRGLLAAFLDQLRGGATKVIITSRSPEDWLGPERRFKLPLGGLDGEERWEFCAAVLRDLGKTIQWKDKDLVELMNMLGGHPLAMRVILPRLEKMSAAQILSELQSNLAGLDAGGDEAQQKLYATLQFVEKSLPEDLRELLLPLGMHESFVDADYLEVMARSVDKQWTRARIDELMGALVAAGLLQDVGQAMYQMHPLLTSFLRATSLQRAVVERRDAWARAFVGFMATFANQSDTPRGAGGLMSWAASKAVVRESRRRAKARLG